jgi:NADH:ubiquinone oxidoreductase subunit 6 (subunit J)
MTLANVIFYFFAALTIVSAAYILFTKNVLYAAFALFTALLGVSAIYVFAGADFLAITQILIYVGGILILILFGIMLTNRIAGQQYVLTGNRSLLLGVFAGLSLFILLITGIVRANFSGMEWIQATSKTKQEASSTIEVIGKNLMTDFILPFEVVALILMVALMGAAFIASKVVKK